MVRLFGRTTAPSFAPDEVHGVTCCCGMAPEPARRHHRRQRIARGRHGLCRVRERVRQPFACRNQRGDAQHGSRHQRLRRPDAGRQPDLARPRSAGADQRRAGSTRCLGKIAAHQGLVAHGPDRLLRPARAARPRVSSRGRSRIGARWHVLGRVQQRRRRRERLRARPRGRAVVDLPADRRAGWLEHRRV